MRFLKPVTAITLLVAAILFSACAGGTSVSLLALEDIPNGFTGPEVISIGADFATISFDSGVPTVCNAPFGETTDYGQVATIPMLSGATLDHVLTFSELEPETTYHYQIIATDDHGNVYRSGDFTFTTTPEDGSVAPPAETNWLSLEQGAQVIAASSNFGGAANDEQWGAHSAIDGSDATAWSSDGDGDDAFIEIQLASETHITSLAVFTRTMANDTAQIFSFTVTTDSGETFGPFELPDADQPYEFEVDFVASSLRFDAESTSGGNTGFVELAAYGELVR